MAATDDITAGTDVPPFERLIGMAVFAPLDLTIRVVEELPSAADGVRQQLVAARFIGKMVVDQSVVELKRRLGGGVPSPDRSAVPSRQAAVDVEGGDAADVGPDDDHDVMPDVPDGADLALPDYEHLPASNVVVKLAGLTQSERDEIEAFESAHRNRRTILGKLDQLREH